MSHHSGRDFLELVVETALLGAAGLVIGFMIYIFIYAFTGEKPQKRRA